MLYLLIEFDIIVSTDGQVDFGSLLLLMSLISLVIGSSHYRFAWKISA